MRSTESTREKREEAATEKITNTGDILRSKNNKNDKIGDEGEEIMALIEEEKQEKRQAKAEVSEKED